MEQIHDGSFVWVIIFLPFWGSPSDPPLPRNPPANEPVSKSSTCRAAHQFFSPAGGDGAPQKKGCILDPILQDTVGPNASAKSDQPPAWCTLLSIEKPNRKERPIEERPGGRVRSADSPPRFHPKGESESYGRSQERECLRWPGIESGDHPRPQMFCTECSGSTLEDMLSEGQWSVSYTQLPFATE